MVGSNTIGGKHHKKNKKHRFEDDKKNKKIIYAENNQIYGIVKKKLGGNRLIVDCSDGKERSAIIPGKFFKKIWINPGDILLCDLNINDNNTQCYILEKYTSKDAKFLKSQGEFNFEVNDDAVDNDSDLVINDDNTDTWSNNNNTNTHNAIDDESNDLTIDEL